MARNKLRSTHFFLSPMVLGLAVVLILTSMLACGDDGPSEEEVQVGRVAALEEIAEAKEALDAKRAELGTLRDQLADPESLAAAEGQEGTEGAEEPVELSEEALAARLDELEIQVNQLASEVEDETEEVVSRIVEFINSDPPIQGEPLTDLQKSAAGLKIEEDVLVAREWIDRGGDYKRAITILEQSLPLDPENALLQAELASAQEQRFVTEERFGGVKKDMTQDEVREVLGPVNLRNVKEYPERKVTLWLYPKDEAGNAAGVYYRKKGDELKVYQTNFSAVNREEGTEDEGA